MCWHKSIESPLDIVLQGNITQPENSSIDKMKHAVIVSINTLLAQVD